MKRFPDIIRFAIVIITILSGATKVFALPTSGNWTVQTISTNQTVNLTGDVTVTGTITVAYGKTLTINGNGHTIKALTHIYTADQITGKDNTTKKTDSKTFYIKGNLIINNAIVDGGNTGTISDSNAENTTAPEWNKSSTAFWVESSIANSAITAEGSLNLTNVTAQKFYAAPSTNDTGFLYLKGCSPSGSLKPVSSATLNNVTVQHCLNENDLGVIYAGGENCVSNIVMNDCNINHCMVRSENWYSTTTSKGSGTTVTVDTYKPYLDKNIKGLGYGGVIKGAGKAECNLTMTNCSVSHCWGSGWGGAVLWAANANGCKAVFDQCTFTYNYARYLGGAISSEATVEIKNCTFDYNEAGYGGGAVAAFPFSLADAASAGGNAVGLTLSGNTMTNNRTLHITNRNSSIKPEVPIANESDYGFNPRYTIGNATDVSYPSGGGAIWVLMNKDKWDCTLNIGNGNKISNNTSAYDGGAVLLYKQKPFTILSETDRKYGGEVSFGAYTSPYGATSMEADAEIFSNEASHSGGGLAVGADAGLTFPTITLRQNAEIYSNTAANGNGGGVYMPGGNFTMLGAKIYNNKALDASSPKKYDNTAGNGGGVSVTQGTFSADATSSVYENECDNWGGGVFVNGNQPVNFNGGNYFNNKAGVAGGGVCVDGALTLTMSGSIRGNSAGNGGGVYLRNYSTLVFKDGSIVANTASGEGTGNTAYNATGGGNIKGIGGGVFLDDNTTLNFQLSGNVLGLYENSASFAADDIFANGNGTTVELPDISNMNLKDYNVPTDVLYWADDFHSNDNNYHSHGTNINTGSTIRYEDAIAQTIAVSYIESEKLSEYSNKYLCLTLGYELIRIKITKGGLMNGHTAEFTLSPVRFYNNEGGDEVINDPYITVLFTGTDDNGSDVSKNIFIPSGYWQIKETEWSKDYELTTKPTPETGREDIYQITRTKNKELEFINTYTNTPNDGDPETPPTSIKVNAEKRVVNKMGKNVKNL